MATISIHAPRTGSDLRICCIPIATCHFNPRSPHGERPMRWNSSCIIARFQSTLPARGATPANARNPGAQGFQSTLPARGATCRGGFHLPLLHISIHAPRTGSDSRKRKKMRRKRKFQSTLPARGATRRYLPLTRP